MWQAQFCTSLPRCQCFRGQRPSTPQPNPVPQSLFSHTHTALHIPTVHSCHYPSHATTGTRIPPPFLPPSPPSPPPPQSRTPQPDILPWPEPYSLTHALPQPLAPDHHMPPPRPWSACRSAPRGRGHGPGARPPPRGPRQHHLRHRRHARQAQPPLRPLPHADPTGGLTLVPRHLWLCSRERVIPGKKGTTNQFDSRVRKCSFGFPHVFPPISFPAPPPKK